MTRFSVNLKNILGLSFYRYELTSDTYNPSIDTAVQITCTVTNIFGTPVEGKAVSLLMDGARIIVDNNGTPTDISDATTDQYGVAEWNITITDWDLHDFQVGIVHTQVKAKGWRYLYGTGSSTWAVARNETQGKLVLRGWGSTISAGADWSATNISTINCPPSQAVIGIDNNLKVQFKIGNDGKTYIRKAMTQSSSLSQANWLELDWNIA